MTTVAGELQAALERVLGEVVVVVCAGRTDAGVHASDQAVTFDTDRVVDVNGLRASINALCRPHIVVSAARYVDRSFDARHSCAGRSYTYRILNRQVPDPFRRRVTWRVSQPLDGDAMQTTVDQLIGVHDFSSFCRRQFVKRGGEVLEKPRSRELRTANWVRSGDELVLTISASSFCQQMVRSIVGLSVSAGLGLVDPLDVPAILSARDRKAVPKIAPPHGLMLSHLDYGDIPFVDVPFGADPRDTR